MKSFRTFGVMLDCSRNAVMSPDKLKHLISLLAKMGYNQLQLYMEDTYEVEGEEYFGYRRGRYSAEELKELDDYAYVMGVELVPCIQTLAHLNAAIRWPKYAEITDINDILLAGDERTYALIDRMFSSLRACFRTRKIHIGMDEAHRIGRGKYQDLHGATEPGEILMMHLERVCGIAAAHGFEPMMWSDMFYRIAYGDYYNTKAKFNPAVKKKIPANLTLVYWDYYHTQKQTYTSLLRSHKQLCDRIVFAGGAWKWAGFTPHNDFSFRATKAALSACREEEIRDVFLTMWGDDGAEASAFSLLPALCYAACIADGISDMASIRARFRTITGCDWNDFLLLDLPDRTVPAHGIINPSKYELYNDCFLGIVDTAVQPEDGKKYASFARRLANAAKRTGEYAYLFDTGSKLCSVLALKANIGNVTRDVYAAKDPERLKALIADYNKMIRRTEAFYYAYREQWYRENKPHGFDVQDIRLGGLLCRMKSCRDRLTDLANGKIDRIPELEEPTLPLLTNACCYNSWRLTATANVL